MSKRSFMQALCNCWDSSDPIDVRNRNTLKILVIGPGACGKSTVLKQMRLVHGEKFSNKERQRFIQPIVENIFIAIHQLVDAFQILNISFKNDHNIKGYDMIVEAQKELLNGIEDWQKNKLKYKDIITEIWQDPSIKVAYANQNMFYLYDSCEYFITNIERIASEGYLPTVEDILRVRQPTTGITEHVFKIDSVDFLFVDVGGQRTERKKWIHCFENATSLMFVASLSDYDLHMTKDELRGTQKNVEAKVNRMREALSLFKTVINTKKDVYVTDNNKKQMKEQGYLFERCGIILFLNKKDLFEKKFPLVSLKNYFSDFNGSGDIERGKEFIARKFLECNEIKDRVVCWHYTFALDQQSMKVAINTVKAKIIEDSIHDLSSF